MKRTLPLVAAILCLLAALAYAKGARIQLIDDAYISFRAAQNLARGDGPVFNPGQRVESATSPLWVAVLALFARLGWGPVQAAPWLLALCAAGAAAVSALCALELAGPLAALIAGVSLALLPSWSAWSATGMEPALAGLCIACAVLAALRERPALSGALLAASALARPEAVLLLPVLALALGRARWPRFLAASLAPLCLLLFARHAYFGQWVPNTYIAKRGGSGAAGLLHGLEYVGGFALAHLVLVLACLRALFRRGAAQTLALSCIAFAAAVAWDGGDHFPLDRLIAPALPLACALFGAEVAALPRPARIFAAGISVLFAWLPFPLRSRSLFNGPHALAGVGDFTVKLRDSGRALRVLPPGRVATVSIGAIGFESDRQILDLVGLADPQIARSPHLAGVAHGHDHSDVDYVLAQRPEFALISAPLAPVTITAAMEEGWLRFYDDYFRAARLLEADPRFRAAYQALDVIAPDGRHLRIWQRR